MRIPILQFPGFEADDVIGTLARRAEQAGFEVVIVSSDKDMLQLVTDRVSMLNPAKDDTWYDPAKVKEFMGVEPEPGGRPAGAQRRRGRQHSRRAGHRRKGRARICSQQFGSVEAALDRAAEVEAQDVPREPARTTSSASR